MRFAANDAAAVWLEGLEAGPESFDWDAGNRTKNLKHGVEAENIEAFLNHPVLLAGRIIEPFYDEPRWLSTRARRPRTPARLDLHATGRPSSTDRLSPNEASRKAGL